MYDVRNKQNKALQNKLFMNVLKSIINTLYIIITANQNGFVADNTEIEREREKNTHIQ